MNPDEYVRKQELMFRFEVLKNELDIYMENSVQRLVFLSNSVDPIDMQQIMAVIGEVRACKNILAAAKRKVEK